MAPRTEFKRDRERAEEGRVNLRGGHFVGDSPAPASNPATLPTGLQRQWDGARVI